ncbi:MAG: AraC family transcriptional regulator [Pseudomonadales bacterium]|nr:AraC family transcriptional regulator [Pseudomonadales bacterium]
MKAVEKAVWYIENHYREEISLDDLARLSGVSRYHLSRIFCYAVGQPISRYVRLRRLSRAAESLASGERDILNLALSVGYSSHEAFTRAFKSHFHKTPEQVRSQRHTDDLEIMEPILMKSTEATTLAEPRYETLSRKLSIVGISRYYPFEKVAEIPDQWQSFAPFIPRVTSAGKPATYGIIYNGSDTSYDYLSGVELPKGADSPENLVRLDIAPQTYAVFEHSGHVANVRDTCDAIWSDWLPGSKQTVVEAPWFEKYGDSFNPQTGEGGLEIWIPVAR